MRRLQHSLALVLIVFALMGGCVFGKAGSDKALLISGESIYGLRTQFIAVGGIYKQGCDVQKPQPISDAQCEKFRVFGEGFKKSYGPAVEAWDLAYRTNDSARRQSAATTVITLSVELAQLAAEVIDLTKGKVR